MTTFKGGLLAALTVQPTSIACDGRPQWDARTHASPWRALESKQRSLSDPRRVSALV